MDKQIADIKGKMAGESGNAKKELVAEMRKLKQAKTDVSKK